MVISVRVFKSNLYLKIMIISYYCCDMAKLWFVYSTDDEKIEWQKVDIVFIYALVFCLCACYVCVLA